MPKGGDKDPECWTRIPRGRQKGSSERGGLVKEPRRQMTNTRLLGDPVAGSRAQYEEVRYSLGEG